MCYAAQYTWDYIGPVYRYGQHIRIYLFNVVHHGKVFDCCKATYICVRKYRNMHTYKGVWFLFLCCTDANKTRSVSILFATSLEPTKEYCYSLNIHRSITFKCVFNSSLKVFISVCIFEVQKLIYKRTNAYIYLYMFHGIFLNVYFFIYACMLSKHAFV